uniref:Uncharacterized protein n=1 Tax=Rhizophora mucronata TaxID=61149 RepID=A0A2P2P861_RHIMU
MCTFSPVKSRSRQILGRN